MGDSQSTGNPELLLRAGLTPHRTSLEDLVAYQWEREPNVLGALHGHRRDAVVLKWLGEAVERAGRPASVLDVGCAYGNHLFMLNALLGKPTDVTLVGVDLFEEAIAYGRAFAETIPGFGNCTFQVGDLSDGLPFDDGTFDAVNLADVMEHLQEPEEALREIRRVAKPGAAVVISTPLRGSVFKRAARLANRATRGRIYRAYYRGKETELDAVGEPVMATSAGLPHVSEMSWKELRDTVRRERFELRRVEFTSVMSGSSWFDEHKGLLAGLLLIEAAQDAFRFPSWAHSVLLDLAVTKSS